MNKEELDKLENPPEGWHKTDKITPCDRNMGDKSCGKITERMYPIYGKFLCEEHKKYPIFPLGLCDLCCSECFEPYWPNFPERCMGEKWSGHCKGGGGCCHDNDRKIKEDRWRKEGDGGLKSIELSISAEGNPMIYIKTERNSYKIYYQTKNEMFRAYSWEGSTPLTHFKLRRQIWYHNASERINIVSYFNGKRDVSKEGIRYEDDTERNDFSLHEIAIPPHAEKNGECSC